MEITNNVLEEGLFMARQFGAVLSVGRKDLEP